MKRLLVLLLLCVLLTGCTAVPHLNGRWVTSPEETLCGIVLIIEAGGFTLIQEGRTSTGRCFYDVGNIKLYEDVEHSAQSGSVWFANYDKSTDTLVLGETLLHRE